MSTSHEGAMRLKAGWGSRLLGCALALAGCGLPLALQAQTPASPAPSTAESTLPAVKAAFVFNIIKLVTWPEQRFAGAADPVQVCVLKGDPMEQPLRDTLAGKVVGLRPMEVLGVIGDQGLDPCHVLYLGIQAAPRYAGLMSRVSGKGVLLVEEGPQFSYPDGMIRLFTEQNRVRFELNAKSLERSGLKVDPRLLSLAHIVTR